MGTLFVTIRTTAVVLAVASCGGAADPLGNAGDAGVGGDGSHADGGDGGGGGGGDAGGNPDGAVDCSALTAEVAALQAKAQACCAMCDIVQCYSAVQGVCCEISVTSKDGAATTAFLAAVAQLEQECHPECPAIACPVAPSGVCDPDGECR